MRLLVCSLLLFVFSSSSFGAQALSRHQSHQLPSLFLLYGSMRPVEYPVQPTQAVVQHPCDLQDSKTERAKGKLKYPKTKPTTQPTYTTAPSRLESAPLMAGHKEPHASKKEKNRLKKSKFTFILATLAEPGESTHSDEPQNRVKQNKFKPSKRSRISLRRTIMEDLADYYSEQADQTVQEFDPTQDDLPEYEETGDEAEDAENAAYMEEVRRDLGLWR